MIRARRRPAVAAGVLCAALALPAAAAATPLLAPEDAAELANALAEARAEQAVCYGWEVTVTDGEQGTEAVEQGSSDGPDTPIDPACEKQVLLFGQIEYTCSVCEAEDSVDVDIQSNLTPGPTVAQLEQLGLSVGDLLGDEDDTTLVNMVQVLPLLAAEQGHGEPLALEPPAAPVPAQDGPTGGSSTPDWLRTVGVGMLVFGLLAAAGVAWLLSLARERRRTRPQPAAAAAAEAGGAPVAEPGPPPSQTPDKE